MKELLIAIVLIVLISLTGCGTHANVLVIKDGSGTIHRFSNVDYNTGIGEHQNTLNIWRGGNQVASFRDWQIVDEVEKQ